jgi:hypothetical protein
MSISVSSPVTGTAQTGLTSPTYTVVADTAPDSNGKQSVVTALGGTQTGVSVHTNSSPFTLTFWRPKFIRAVGVMNNIGWIVNNPVNVYKVITRKGVLPAAGERPQVCTVTTVISVPAGADTYDIVSIRAALSLHIGALSQQSAGIGDLANNGVL